MRNLAIVCFAFFLISCNCQKHSIKTSEKSTSIKTNEPSIIEGVLTENSFAIFNTFTEVSVYDIKKTLIDGTTNEYSNKLVFNRKLPQETAALLVQEVLTDASYNWKEYKEEVSYKATKQIIVKNQYEQINLMYDPELQLLGFFTLEGQNVIPVSDTFNLNILKLLKNE